MEVIKCLSEDIECTLDMSEENIKKAYVYKEEFPNVAKALYTKSMLLLDSIKPLHDAIVAVIENYRKENGEPPVPMIAVYNYMHERQINQSAMIKSLQELFTK